jgi:5'-deoxynucleotidase YfbR-like HD superfamily hydrolase
MNIDSAIAIARAALTFGQVQRATLHPDGTAESDATHTVMLAMVVADLARAEGLDIGLAVQFAVVHDLPETYALDTNTARGLTPSEAAAKAAREAASLVRLAAELGPCWSTSMVQRYESQREPEARLVRYADKILPKLTHVLNGGLALAAIDMTVREVMAKHAEQGAKLRAEYPEFAATRALFDAACERALGVMQAREQGLAPVVGAEGESQGLAVEDATELEPGHEVVGAADAPARASIQGNEGT